MNNKNNNGLTLIFCHLEDLNKLTNIITSKLQIGTTTTVVLSINHVHVAICQFLIRLTSIGVRSSRILSAELTHSFTSKLSSENLEKSMSISWKIKLKNKRNYRQLTTHLPPFWIVKVYRWSLVTRGLIQLNPVLTLQPFSKWRSILFFTCKIYFFARSYKRCLLMHDCPRKERR